MPMRHVSIARLEMTNFKRFYGHHTLDLLSQPDVGKPLVLIGGDNGRGKTSIHEAIYYALYEDGDLPGIQTHPSYLRAVSERLNRRALDEGSGDFLVAIDLLIDGVGADRSIRIERQWEVSVGQRCATQANLSIYENGRPVDEDSPQAYQDFLRTILPPRIAPFFFFDGERIQQFADDEDQERRMVEAIEDILHITVYKSLRNDLRAFVIDDIEHDIRQNASDDLFELLSDKERIEGELEEKRDRFADVERDVEELERDQKRIEEELRRIGSPHSPQRDELIEERARLNAELEEAKRQLQSGFEPLPILLAGSLLTDLRTALEKEQSSVATPERVEQLRKALNEIRRRVLEKPSPPPPRTLRLSSEQLRFYCECLDRVGSEALGLTTSETDNVLHDIGDAGRRNIIERIGTVSRLGSVLADAIDARERLSSELREVETRLQATSDDPHVGELIRRNKEVSERKGALEEEGRALQGEIQRLEADLAGRSRQIEERHLQREETNKAKQAIRTAQKARRALDEFIRRLAPDKLALLQQYMDEMYARLRKPEDPVASVEIDPETWQVVLKDARGRKLEKRVFSAGMKEMYALSLLWALSKASGRELPIVIDTPVGRLDTTNRRTLFEKYLPHAGHQVIVLSTDTEIDVEWARRLEPHVARQYRLDFDRDNDSIVIRVGYFF